MLKIDGSFGEGGGQIVRSSLALAMVTGTPITIDKIRAGRDKPGLKRQHATGVQAAAEVCGGSVEGCEVGSPRLVFVPGQIRAGDYHFRIGTAGSTTLVLQTILPALWLADGPSTVTLEGGTHNPFAPPFDFLAKSYLPLLQRIGIHTRAAIERPGFHPAGGGKFTVHVQPVERFRPFSLTERGKRKERRVRALVAKLPRHIGERQCDTMARKSGWGRRCCSIEEINNTSCAGNVVVVEMEYENVTHVAIAFGKQGLAAEKVAGRAWRAAKSYLDVDVPVGEHLADQLVLPLAISAHTGGVGGQFRTSNLSQHTTTHLEVVKMFMDLDIEVQQKGKNDFITRIHPHFGSSM